MAASVAAFGMLLRHSPHSGTATYAGVIELAGEAVGEDDEFGLGAEFVELAKRAQQVSGAR